MSQENRKEKTDVKEKLGLKTLKDAAGTFGSSLGKNLSKASESAAKKAGEALGNASADTIKQLSDALSESGSQLLNKALDAFGDNGKDALKKAGDLSSETVEMAQKIMDELNHQKEQIEKDGFSETALVTTQQLITKVAAAPMVRVNREDFLRKTFGKSPYIEEIIAQGPQAVFSLDSIRKKADDIIDSSTRKTSVASFAAGLPSNLVAMTAAGIADITQYFAFALNLAQKIAYLFGEDTIFTDPAQVTKAFVGKDDLTLKDGTAVSEEAQVRLISYLGAMMGVTGAGCLILKTSQKAGASIGKKIAAKALTKTAWYPLVKKIGSILGYKITKKTVESVVSKAVPIAGGAISGGITYLTFRPMGGKLADEFVKIANGEYDEEMELNPEFLAKLNIKEDLEKNIIDELPESWKEIEEEINLENEQIC